MNPSIARLLLLLLSIVLIVLPLLPALIEIRTKSDAKPLNVIQQHGGEIRHFAQGFRKYVSCLAGPIQQCRISGVSAKGLMPDQDSYLLLAPDDAATVVAAMGSACRSIVATVADIALPVGATFMKEVYAVGRLMGGERNAFRAVLGESDVRLARATTVSRWIHATGLLETEEACELYGRASSDREIRMGSGCTFQRLNAPRIDFGRLDKEAETSAAIRPTTALSRSLIDEDVQIEAGAIIHKNIVTRGKLHIGSGVRISGSLKSHGHMHLDPGVRIEGSLISASTMTIGRDCEIAGPVIGEYALTIEHGTRCGTLDNPTTVSAPRIFAAEGVTVFGSVWARDEGRVVAHT